MTTIIVLVCLILFTTFFILMTYKAQKPTVKEQFRKNVAHLSFADRILLALYLLNKPLTGLELRDFINNYDGNIYGILGNLKESKNYIDSCEIPELITAYGQEFHTYRFSLTVKGKEYLEEKNLLKYLKVES